ASEGRGIKANVKVSAHLVGNILLEESPHALTGYPADNFTNQKPLGYRVIAASVPSL
ncbi:MAG: hypothetical protein ACJAWF_003604, partial [Candidatus Azotimanducaceae bacterium]